MENDLLNQGLTLMLAGMGTVFVFLALLVTAMTVMAHFLAPPAAVAGPDVVSDDEVAAITAAINLHRNQ